MATRHWQLYLIGAIGAVVIAAAFFIDPIPQDPGYHAFADRGRMLGIPNFWNVVTNLPFLVAGIVGLARLPRLAAAALRAHYIVFCIGVSLVGFGSAYYHCDPSTPALVWDRLPMTIAFMALFAAVLSDRVSQTLGRAMLWPLITLGIASIAWWIRTELAGQGDLRPYAIVQFLPMLLVPLILLLSRGGGLGTVWLWASLGAYVGAKLAEHFDPAILDATGVFSGHSLKHLLAALGAWFAVRAFQKSPARAL
ncbi:MAG TPA: ceramidase domain-containing protein [Steroidobacteraceae bacterium]